MGYRLLWIVSLWLLLACPSRAGAQALGLAWDFDRTYQPAPSAFVLTIAAGGSTQRWSTLPSPLGACPGQPPASFCTVVPCPTASPVQITVAAVWGTQIGPGDTWDCVLTSHIPCLCTAMGTGPGVASVGQPVTAALPAIQAPPALPLFQPGVSRAPV